MSIKIVRDTTTDGARTIVALKGADQYHLIFYVCRRRELYQVLGRWAANPELSFNWHDMGQVCRYINATLQVKS